MPLLQTGTGFLDCGITQSIRPTINPKFYVIWFLFIRKMRSDSSDDVGAFSVGKFFSLDHKPTSQQAFSHLGFFVGRFCSSFLSLPKIGLCVLDVLLESWISAGNLLKLGPEEKVFNAGDNNGVVDVIAFKQFVEARNGTL